MVAKSHAVPQNSSARPELDKGVRVNRKPRGYGAMRDVPLDLDLRIDLTRPILEQVLALEEADKKAAGQS